MKSNILVIGSLNMDMVVVAPRHPQVGETILGNSYATYPGGKGGNQAVAAARMSGNVTMIGCVGRDDFGRSLLDNLMNNQVNTSAIKETDVTHTGTAMITVDSQGKNSIIVVPGANYQLLPADMDLIEPVIASARLVVLQLEVPLITVSHAIEIACKHRIPVILNPAPAQPLPEDLLRKIDYLIPNETELGLLTGMPVETLAEIESACQRLVARGVKGVVLTRGEKGAYYQDKQKQLNISSYAVQAVDTTAAGDAFIGGFASSILEGKEVRSAIMYGCAAGALACTKAGAQTSLPTRQEVEGFLEAYQTKRR